MDIQKGEIYEGKVTGIAKFGAFVELEPGKSGLVYISEIATTFVRDVSDFLAVGQQVRVKVISIDEAGRLNLSIKQALPERPKEPRQDTRPRTPRRQDAATATDPVTGEERPVDPEFEDKLKRFMKDSDSRLSEFMRHSERRGPKRRR